MPANINYGNLYTLLANANRSAGRMSYHSGTTPAQIKDMITFIEQGMSPGQAATMASRNVKPQVQPVQEQPVEQTTSTPFIDVNADPYFGEKQPTVSKDATESTLPDIQPVTTTEEKTTYDPMNTGATAAEIQKYDFNDPDRIARIEAMFPSDETPAYIEETPAYETLIENQPFIEDTPAYVEDTPAYIDIAGDPYAGEKQPTVSSEATESTLPDIQPVTTVEETPAYVEETPAYVEETPAYVEAAPAYVEAAPAYVEAAPAYETLVQNQPFIDINNPNPYAGGEAQPTVADRAGGISEVVDDTGIMSDDAGIMSLANDAITKRKEANDAVASATNSYEADVAEFKDIEAKDAEAKVTAAFDAGIGSFGAATAAKGDAPVMPSASGDISGGGAGIDYLPSSPQPITKVGTASTTGRSRYDPVNNWGEPEFEAYIPESEIIKPEDFTTAEKSPFMDDNPYNNVFEAPGANVTANVGAGAGSDARVDYAPVNNPFEPVEVAYDSTRDQIIDPNAPDPRIGWWDDPNAPGPDPKFWDPNTGTYGPPPDDEVVGIPALPDPVPTPRPPPPEDLSPMNRLIYYQTGMFGGQPQGGYQPYEQYSTAPYTRPMSVSQFGAAPGMPKPVEANQGRYINQQPTRNLKKLFNNPLDQGLAKLPVTGQNDTLTQIFQAGFRPRR